MAIKLKTLITLIVCVHAVWACTQSSDDIVTSGQDKEIFVLFGPDSWGDNGYNDLIYSGLLDCIGSDKLKDVKVRYVNPTSMSEALKLIASWKKDSLAYNKRLLVLANAVYKDVINKDLSGFTLDDKSNSVLLFESGKSDIKGVHTFMLSLYGTSYISGAVAAKLHLTPLIVLGNSRDSITASATDGFTDGFRDYGEKNAEIAKEYLSDTYNGYNMPDSTYNLMHQWAQNYNFIFPIMGGSIMGVFHYLRENPNKLFTVGMDVDQSNLCNELLGSMTKNIDSLFSSWLIKWASGETLPQYATYGLEEGYTEWKKANIALEDKGIDIEEIKVVAIRKEKEYENN